MLETTLDGFPIINLRVTQTRKYDQLIILFLRNTHIIYFLFDAQKFAAQGEIAPRAPVPTVKRGSVNYYSIIIIST